MVDLVSLGELHENALVFRFIVGLTWFALTEIWCIDLGSDWGEAQIEVQDSGRKTSDEDFPGFPDKETALVYLTQPMSGHFYRNESQPRLACWEVVDYLSYDI